MDTPPLPALPDRAADAGFRRCLADLLGLVRTHLPARAVEAGEGEEDQRGALRKALGYLDSDYPDLPEPFFDALLQAAVLDPDPSLNRQFVEPLKAAFGARRTQEALLHTFATGTNPERAGVARAWYWATLETFEDLEARWNRAALHEFVANDDLDVRRCVLPLLPLDPADHPAETKPLVDAAIRIARTHSDAYLRQRVELQVADPG
ncbi:hypothetical protein [Amycolatopsis sp. CA-128772]|uniref:hypothetical protein n=1 Tax=Amycolatopsis sp. CA-128772 TaxID=2073159 RepID=UPI000CD095D4|nr:hypothetical protein [Amycolatopsis sp. CA-128772]